MFGGRGEPEEQVLQVTGEGPQLVQGYAAAEGELSDETDVVGLDRETSVALGGRLGDQPPGEQRTA